MKPLLITTLILTVMHICWSLYWVYRLYYPKKHKSKRYARNFGKGVEMLTPTETYWRLKTATQEEQDYFMKGVKQATSCNEPLLDWDVSKIGKFPDMSKVFKNCEAL